MPTFSLTQDTSQTNLADIALDNYSLEEFIPLVEEELKSYNHCDLAFFMYWLCGSPLFPQHNEQNITEDNLYPFQSLVDMDALLEYYGDFLKQKIAFDLRGRNYFYTYTEEQQKETLAYNEDFDTWEDYVASEQQHMYKSAIADIIADYTDGYAYFMENQDFDYIQAWSTLKMQHYLQWINLQYYPPYIEGQVQNVLAKAEAEALLGATATLLRIQRRYQIVDESGQALAPLEDGVETRFGTKAFGDFEVVDIRVLFDLTNIIE